MTKRSKKILCALMAGVILCLCFCSCGGKKIESFSLPTRALAENAEEKSYSTFKYKTYDDGAIIITAYTGSDTSLIIPDKIDGSPVVELAEDLFSDNTSLKSVKIGKYVEIIGAYCFYGCTALVSLDIPSGVWFIGNSAFRGTPWIDSQTAEFVIVGDGVLIKYQGSSAYVEIPDNVKHISDAFKESLTLKGVNMGPSVLTVGPYAFAFCPYLRDIEFGENLVYVGDCAFLECELITSLILPDKLEKIGESAFMYCIAITNIRMGNGLKEIGDYAFARSTHVRIIYMPKSVQSVGYSAFLELYYLENVFYEGSEEELAALEIDTSNYSFLDAKKVYGAKKGA